MSGSGSFCGGGGGGGDRGGDGGDGGGMPLETYAEVPHRAHGHRTDLPGERTARHVQTYYGVSKQQT